MANLRASARTLSAHKKRTEPLLLLPIKLTADQRQRFKVACAEEATTYAGLIMQMLDERDKKLNRQRAAQVSPLHPARRASAAPTSAYPGGSHNP